MKKPVTILPEPFPTQITMKVRGLVNNDKTQTCQVSAVFADGLSYTGSAVILRRGPELNIHFKGEL